MENVIYQVVTLEGGGLYSLEDLLSLFKVKGNYAGKMTRAELQGQPELENLIGPMYNGMRADGKTIIRYETQKVYNLLFGLNKTETLENGVEIIENYEENRLQIKFPGIPAESLRDKLKAFGFRWSRFHGTWQSHLSNGAIYWARDISEAYEA